MYVFPTDADKDTIKSYVKELQQKYIELGKLI